MEYLDKTGLTRVWGKIVAKIPTNNNQLTNGAGYITGITSGDVTTALGYTPINTTKVKNTQSTTAGDVYDVRYINTMLGDIESLLGGI